MTPPPPEVPDGADDPEATEAQGPVVRDKRRVDPVTGAVRPSPPRPGGDAAGPGPGADPASDDVSTELDRARAEAESLLADVQRLQAEYANYRRRVERDREAVRQQAVASVLNEQLPILDDIGRAREHGDLTGAFKAVGEQLEAVATKLGLQRFGDAGDPFDPKVHEALLHAYSDEVDEPTCTEVLLPGYRIGDRILRPARVSVAEPTVSLPDTSPDEPSDPLRDPLPGEGDDRD